MPTPTLQSLLEVPVSEDALSQGMLDISEKTRSNLFPWTGQFSPQLVQVLLSRRRIASARVCDPFMGSGTVLIESASLGLEACGVEVNLAPYLMASVYRSSNLAPAARYEAIRATSSLLNTIISEPMSLETCLGGRLGRLALGTPDPIPRLYLMVIVILLDLGPKRATVGRIRQIWTRLRSIVEGLPATDADVAAVLGDARRVPRPSESIDLVITSPPYINVFNYHQKYRASVEVLGGEPLASAKSEIGSNRKNRGNRFLTVIGYCLEMGRAFQEINRILSADGEAFVVVGRESNVRKTSFYNASIVLQLGLASGLRCSGRRERSFVNRFGNRIFEDILHFERGDGDGATDQFRQIGYDALEDAVTRVSPEACEDLASAIGRHFEVEASPLYSPKPSRVCRNG